MLDMRVWWAQHNTCRATLLRRQPATYPQRTKIVLNPERRPHA